MSLTASASNAPRGWRSALHLLRREPNHSRILGGSILMLIGSGLVSAINFGYNVAVARMLGPAAFGHAAAAITLLMLLSAVTLSYQLVCAKFVAKNETSAAKAAVYHALMHKAWYVGIVIGSFLAIASREVASYLHWPSARLVLLLAVGIAFYVPLGVKRGGLQGTCAFTRLSGNFILETLVKFCGAIIAIRMGFGVEGAVGAISASVMVAYFLPPVSQELRVARGRLEIPASFREGMQAIVFFIGQVIINNIDIILVKHFFDPSVAGVYAAIALVGRVVYLLSWSVVSAMFPVSASAKREDDSPAVLAVPLVLVLLIAIAFTAGLTAFPDLAIRAIFGSIYHATSGVDSLLSIYAATTGLYSLSMVLMAYEMSRKIANSGFIQLAFSGMIVLGIEIFHNTLRQVVLVQLVLMVFLLIVSAMPFFRTKPKTLKAREELPFNQAMELTAAATASVAPASLKKIRRVPEAEVITAFLRNEFYHREFDRDREQFRELVMNPDITSDSENALRRALLFRRRATMWHELPPDTQWYEVELARADLQRIYAFPRAQWRKLADGNFRLADMVDRIRHHKYNGVAQEFMHKIMALSAYLTSQHDNSTILLITVDQEHPMTLIEGNHRMTAAMLAGEDVTLSQFRYLCGFSPHMDRCCWYQTNLGNLSRYAMKRLRLLVQDEEDDLQRWLAARQAAAGVMENVNEPAARKTA
jgi:O-antigen/teichoic acid export membrane protein